LRGRKSDDGAAVSEDDRVVRHVLARITRELPPSVVAGLALAVTFAAVSTLATIAPRAARVDRTGALSAATATPRTTATPTPSLRASPTLDDAVRLPPLLPGVDRPTPPPRPTPEPAPVALGIAPEAGGIVFRHCCEKGQLQGVWRYDGATGTVARLGVNGEPTIDGRGYVVRQDDAHFVLVDAAAGTTEPVAPLGAMSADAAPTGSDLISAFAEGSTWVVPRTGDPRRITTDLSVATVRISPDARRLALVGPVLDRHASPPPLSSTELWIVDLPDGAPRRLVQLRPGSMGPTIQLGPWSPDGTLLAYWEVSISGSINADGVRLRAVDVRSGATHDLGTTLYGASRLSWKAPHTLAFVAGGGRETWSRKAVRIWSPERGTVDVTTAGTVGLNPSWSADGTKLYFITAGEHQYVPVDFFAGRDSGARGLSVYDLTTKRITTLASPGAYVYEGVRQSRDGKQLLVMWRPTYDVRALQDLPAISMTLGLLDLATGRATPLVRIAGDVGFGYYGSYDGPEGMAWSMGR
jgi:hypothetical protein